MQNAILYQAYGGIDFVNECRYSLLKYLQVYNLQLPPTTGIHIYTDQPHLFECFLPFIPKLECIPVNEATVRQWKGKLGFVHRFKIEMIRDFLNRFTGSLLYCDTDTYATAPLETVFKNIEQGSYYMHEYEGTIDKTKAPSFYKWEKFLSTTPVGYNGKQMVFSNTLQMFNAGAVGLHSSKKDLLADILALADNIYEKFPKHIAEQFAFSYCLQKSGAIKTADNFIAHYWNLKEFRQLLATFFSVNAEKSIPALVKKVHHLNAISIMRQKMVFQQLPAWRRFYKKLTGSGWRITEYEKKL